MLSCVKRAFTSISTLIVVIIATNCAQAQTHRLEINVSDFFHFGPLPARGELQIRMVNPADSVAGFTLWLQLSRPDIVKFRTTGFAAYQDSIGGTLVGNWEYLLARSVAGDGSDIKITGIAEADRVPPIRRGCGPSDTARILLRIPYQIVPGTDTIGTPHVDVIVNTETPLTLSFSTPTGITVPCFDSSPVPQLDTSVVKIQNGGVFVDHCTCLANGDANGDGLGLSVGDWVHTIRAVQGMINTPDSICHADFNGDCRVDTADLRIYQHYFDSGMIVFLPFHYPFPAPTCCNVALKICCQGSSGNVDCDPEGRVDISDLAALLDHLYVGMSQLCCWGSANVDGDPARVVDIADLSALIDYLYINYTRPAACF